MRVAPAPAPATGDSRRFGWSAGAIGGSGGDRGRRRWAAPTASTTSGSTATSSTTTASATTASAALATARDGASPRPGIGLTALRLLAERFLLAFLTTAPLAQRPSSSRPVWPPPSGGGLLDHGLRRSAPPRAAPSSASRSDRPADRRAGPRTVELVGDRSAGPGRWHGVLPFALLALPALPALRCPRFRLVHGATVPDRPRPSRDHPVSADGVSAASGPTRRGVTGRQPIAPR